MDLQWIEISKMKYKVYLLVHNNDIKKISKIIKPYFELKLVSHPDEECFKIEPYFSISKKQYDRKMSVIQPKFEDINEPKRKYVYSETDKYIGILYPYDKNLRLQIAIRITRDILRNFCIKEEMAYFHSGMVSYKGKGICIMGDKKCGKTTTILSLLSSKDSYFVSNDDLALHICDNILEGVGWPRTISIRNDSLEYISNIINDYKFPNVMEHPNNYIEAFKKSTFLYPYELSEVFDSKLIDIHKIDIILLPQFNECSSNQLIEISKDEGIKIIKSFYERDINKYFRDFENNFKFKKCSETKIYDSILASNVKIYILNQNITRMEESIKLIDSLF